MPSLVYIAILLTRARAQLVDAAASVFDTDGDGHVARTHSSFKSGTYHLEGKAPGQTEAGSFLQQEAPEKVQVLASEKLGFSKNTEMLSHVGQVTDGGFI